MNAKQAKQLDFPELLSRMGYQPVRGGIKRGGNEIWYQSPLANEKTASFHISRGSQVAWVFKCFSTGIEGHILDFVIAHEGYATGDVKSALAFLRKKFPGPLFTRDRVGDTQENQGNFSFHQQGDFKPLVKLSDNSDRNLEYIADLPLKSDQVLAYLEQKRKIPALLAQRFLRLVRYRNLKLDKIFYAFGMRNESGGFEIRAASDQYNFKSALIARDISVISGRGDTDDLMIFEGMMDFLSLLVMMKQPTPYCDAVILHSLNSYQRCLVYIKSHNYQQIHTFLDNDPTGQKYILRFDKDLGASHFSQSSHFDPHKDLNEALKVGYFPSFYFPDWDEPTLNTPGLDQ